MLKFTYSEKVTKFEKFIMYVLSNIKKMGEFFAFSEYLNFNLPVEQILCPKRTVMNFNTYLFNFAFFLNKLFWQMARFSFLKWIFTDVNPTIINDAH